MSNDLLRKGQVELFVKHIKLDLEDITERFITIGFRLDEANNLKYYKDLGYNSIEELAEDMFGIGRSTTYEMMAVWRRFHSIENQMRIQAKYKGYSFSQLVEIKKYKYIPSNVREQIPANASVRDIRAYVSASNKAFYSNGMRETLDEWKARMKEVEELATNSKQEEIALPATDEGDELEDVQCTITEVVVDDSADDVVEEPVVEPEEETVEDVDEVEETVEEEQEKIQTSGQKNELEHIFPFNSREDIRKFLVQVDLWNCKRVESTDVDERMEMVSEHIFRNGDRIVAYKNRTLPNSVMGEWDFTIHYFFKRKYAFGLYECSKYILVEYMMEHREEL